MNVTECIDTLIAGKFILGDSCKLNEVVSTISFDRDDLRVHMYYGSEDQHVGKFELVLFDLEEQWYTDIATTFDKKDCPCKNVDKKTFLDIVCNTKSKGDILKKFHDYDINRTLEAL